MKTSTHSFKRHSMQNLVPNSDYFDAEFRLDKPRLTSPLQRWWQGLLHLLANRAEPQVSQKWNRFGEMYWQVYDPQTGRHHSFGSETEVRIWLEQRYYG